MDQLYEAVLKRGLQGIPFLLFHVVYRKVTFEKRLYNFHNVRRKEEQIEGVKKREERVTKKKTLHFQTPKINGKHLKRRNCPLKLLH